MEDLKKMICFGVKKGDSLAEVLMHCNLGDGSTCQIVAVPCQIVAVPCQIVADSCDYLTKKAICLGRVFFCRKVINL